MKTLFITIYSSFIAKNILRTDTIEVIKGMDDLRIVIIVDTKRADEYRRLFGGERVIVEGVETTQPLFEQRFVSLARHALSTRTLTLQLFGGPLSPRKGVLGRGAVYLTRFLFGNALGRTVLRVLDMALFREEPYAALFERYKPDMLFATDVYAPLDIEFLREARRRKVKTVGMVKSWDNLTSKGIVRQTADHMIVHTRRMRDELSSYHGVSPEKVFVSGVPQYDMYFRPDGSDRLSFWKKYGLDGRKKVILYLEPGLKLAPHGHEIWQILDEALSTDKDLRDTELFISVHPAYPIEEKTAGALRTAKIVRFGYRLDERDMKTWEFSDEALKELMRAVRHSDLVINTWSTMNIESSILDRPIIDITFDGHTERPYEESIRQYEHYTHLDPIVRSGGIKVAHSREELLEQVRYLLAHPEWGREGRRRIVEEECVYTDGKSGERLGSFILACLE